jgi:hypothetical protein
MPLVKSTRVSEEIRNGSWKGWHLSIVIIETSRRNWTIWRRMSKSLVVRLPIADSLFDRMEQHCVEYAVDLSLEYPCEIGANNVAHLRPGRMLIFRDADGEMVKTALAGRVKGATRSKRTFEMSTANSSAV